MTIGGDGDDNTRGTGDIVCVFAVCYIGIPYLALTMEIVFKKKKYIYINILYINILDVKSVDRDV